MDQRLKNIEIELEKAVGKLNQIEARLNKAGVEVVKSVFAPIVYPSELISTSGSGGEAALSVVALPFTITISAIAWPFLAIGNGVRVHKLKRRREKYQNILRIKTVEMIEALKQLKKSRYEIVNIVQLLHISFIDRSFIEYHLRYQISLGKIIKKFLINTEVVLSMLLKL